MPFSHILATSTLPFDIYTCFMHHIEGRDANYELILFLYNPTMNCPLSITNVEYNYLIRRWGKIGQIQQEKSDQFVLSQKPYNMAVDLKKSKLNKGYSELEIKYKTEDSIINKLESIILSDGKTLLEISKKYLHIPDYNIIDEQKVKLIFDTMISQFENKKPHEYPIDYDSIFNEIISLGIYNNITEHEVKSVIDSILRDNPREYDFIKKEDYVIINNINNRFGFCHCNNNY